MNEAISIILYCEMKQKYMVIQKEVYTFKNLF
jgi:hypothetical protein